MNIYQFFLQRKKIIKRLAVYAVMTSAVMFLVTFIVFFMLGFRFDTDNGRIEQHAFLQFGSSPSGATVIVNGKTISSKTPNKTTIPAGKHEIIIKRNGYNQWQKVVDVKAGNITWLNYALLVPINLEAQLITEYVSIYASLGSPDGRNMLIQSLSDTPSFDLVDLSSDTIKTTKLDIPEIVYSEAGMIGVDHTFKIIKWDDSSRYVLVSHVYADKTEWLVLDTQDANLSKNITRLFNIPITSIDFAGAGGNTFFILNQSDIRKLNLSAGTISRPLVGNVISFETYKSSIITYIGVDANDLNNRVVGVYRDGEEAPYVLKTVIGKDSELRATTTRYYNENYVAIADGAKIDILSGSYPATTKDSQTSMKSFASFEFSKNVTNLSFSPSGEYVFVQSGENFGSFDLEYQTQKSSVVAGTGDVSALKWLDDNYVWSDRGGNLVICEFDGANSRIINEVTVGQDIVLTHNGKYIYSINKTDEIYQLQRVLMIVP